MRPRLGRADEANLEWCQATIVVSDVLRECSRVDLVCGVHLHSGGVEHLQYGGEMGTHSRQSQQFAPPRQIGRVRYADLPRINFSIKARGLGRAFLRIKFYIPGVFKIMDIHKTTKVSGERDSKPRVPDSQAT